MGKFGYSFYRNHFSMKGRIVAIASVCLICGAAVTIGLSQRVWIQYLLHGIRDLSQENAILEATRRFASGLNYYLPTDISVSRGAVTHNLRDGDVDWWFIIPCRRPQDVGVIKAGVLDAVAEARKSLRADRSGLRFSPPHPPRWYLQFTPKGADTLRISGGDCVYDFTFDNEGCAVYVHISRSG
jgi:hypothetical protein